MNIPYFISMLSIIIITAMIYQVLCPYDRRKASKTQTELGVWHKTNVYKKKEIFYTQGLFFADDNTIIESGGMYKESIIAKMKFPSMEVIVKTKLPDKAFGEGIAKCGNDVYQLTWRERDVYKYTLDQLKLVQTLKLTSEVQEGWGLSEYEDGKLIATDGSDKIYTLKCGSLELLDTLHVTYNGKPVYHLNDLTWAHNYIYANVYYATQILKIDPNSGAVVNVYEMKALQNHELKMKTLTIQRLNQGEVLNGIAYNKNKDNFLVTGKRWGYFYEVDLN